ncbi:hypothetical protein ODS41_09880 [Pyrobaculum sp. 3827-6]|uniref:hypothetical protein n=1 Tax=Pyrobaculum sp. 3827-6 TaxID=2983604 RepID=UPI0021DA3EA6|nr:hypothetical protein [Pyrobaculum sp. 3827-6]MCU7788218.1 hypothetical protein [Pyrobaculum sp. 3827-6]
MPPKNTQQIKNMEKPAAEKAKKLAIAALALLVLVAPVLAQQSGKDLVLNSGAVESVRSAAGALMAVWGIAWWASLIIFGLYYFVMSKLAPASWARWGYINDLIDKYKWLLLTMLISPFAVGLVVLGVDLAAKAWGTQSQLDPLKTVTDFLSQVLIKSIVDASNALRFW